MDHQAGEQRDVHQAVERRIEERSEAASALLRARDDAVGEIEDPAQRGQRGAGRSSPPAKSAAAASEIAVPSTVRACGWMRGWNRKGRRRRIVASNSKPKRALSTREFGAALRGSSRRARAAGRVDQVALPRDVRQPLELARQLVLADPAPPPGKPAVETELLGGVVLHGDPPGAESAAP